MGFAYETAIIKKIESGQWTSFATFHFQGHFPQIPGPWVPLGTDRILLFTIVNLGGVNKFEEDIWEGGTNTKHKGQSKFALVLKLCS